MMGRGCPYGLEALRLLHVIPPDATRRCCVGWLLRPWFLLEGKGKGKDVVHDINMQYFHRADPLCFTYPATNN